MKTLHLKSERGVATMIALLMMGMLVLIGLAALSTSDDEVQIAGNEFQEMKAFYAAEAGLEKAAAQLQKQYDSTGAPPLAMPSGTAVINNCGVAYQVADDGPATTRPLTYGTLAGLNALVKSFTTTAVGVSTVDRAKVELSQSFETALIPLFQFAVFYGNDLEIAPGADMSLIGRVHSNGNLWVQANNTLKMDSYVTASGDILHGRKGPGGVSNGDVMIKDANGNHVTMKMGGSWMDANYSDWYDSSIARWGGRVQDGSHGQTALNLPLTTSSDPHSIIERADGGNEDSYENKAGLIIKDGVAIRRQSDGSWLDVTANMVADGVLSYTPNKFMDQREGERVDATELDMEKLYDNGYEPDNGVLYFADDITSSSEWPALRLNNGEELGDNLTIASENPVYINGDYNKHNKKSAALMADAVSFLSNNWNDFASNLTKYDRPATQTTVNVSYMTGNVETTSSNYNGGFENLPRFLERWSGVDFNWKGSAVNLWNSVQAYSTWNGSYYDPPNRNWEYDTDLDDPNKLPPETPTVRVFQRTNWKQSYVGADE